MLISTPEYVFPALRPSSFNPSTGLMLISTRVRRDRQRALPWFQSLDWVDVDFDEALRLHLIAP